MSPPPATWIEEYDNQLYNKMSDHADEGISKKEENKREEVVSESDIMMQIKCSEVCERGRFNKFCIGRKIR